MENLITIPDDKKLVFVSDFHFFHKKLTRQVENHFLMCRDYDTVESMNAEIIKHVNEVSDENTYLVFLGDFFMGLSKGKMQEEFFKITDQLRFAKMIMVFGNHDHDVRKVLKENNVEFHPYVNIKYMGQNYFCQHHDFNECPVYFDKEVEAGRVDLTNLVLVHGHTHSPLLTSKFRDYVQNCVCYEVAYRPLSSGELFAASANVPANMPLSVNTQYDYYAEIASGQNMGLEELIEDQIHHAMSSAEVCANAEEMYEKYGNK